jgi:hypothetical protein
MGMTMGKGGAKGDMVKAKKPDKREKDDKTKEKLHMEKVNDDNFDILHNKSTRLLCPF